MKMILAATSVFALAALVGCAKEDYSDPTAFAEKYLREAVDKRYPVETALKPMRFKGVKLLNVKRELAESFSGTLDRVSCDFEPIPESGVKYYARPVGGDLSVIEFGDKKIVSLKDAKYDILSQDERIDMTRKMYSLRDKRPDLVQEVQPSGGKMIVYRAKNDKGVFEPVKVGSSMVRFEGGLSDPVYTFTDDRLAEMHVLVMGSKEADAAITAHRTKCEEVNRLVEELNGLRAKLGVLTEAKQNEIRRLKVGYSDREYERESKLQMRQQMKARQESTLARLKKAEQAAASQRGRQRRGQKTVDAASVEARIREMDAEIESLRAQSAKDKNATEARVSFLEKLVAYERGEADKVEPADGISEEEKSLISQPSIASEIQPKLQRLKELLGE